MRTLSATLEAAQQAYGEDTRVPYIAVTVGGSTFYCDSILKLEYISQPWSDYCEIWIDDSDNSIGALRRADVVVNLGFVTGAGNETSPYPPLQVRRQEFLSYEGRLINILYCYGLLDDMKERRARISYSAVPAAQIVDILVGCLTTLDGGDDAPYGQYPTAGIVLDGSPTLTLTPGSSFQVAYNEPQATAIERLLNMTESVIRLEDDGYPHVFEPTQTVDVWDYTYKLSWDTITWDDIHEFTYNKHQFNAILPNYIVVENDDNDPDTHYEGVAQNASSVADYGRVDFYWKYNNLTSNDEAAAIAEALLARFATKSGGNYSGSFAAAVNVGLELYDWIAINDARTGQYNQGNVGYIRTLYEAGKYEQFVSFGSLSQMGLPQPEAETEADQRQIFLPTWVINGTLSASDDMQGAFMRAPGNCTMDWTMAAVVEKPVGAAMIIEIWYFDADDPWPGSLVWYNTDNRLTVADGTNDGFSYLHNTGDLQTVRWGGFWYIKVKQVGSTTPGTTLTVTLCAIRTGRYVEKGSGETGSSETGSQSEATATNEISAESLYYHSAEWYASRPGLLGKTARGRWE